MTEEDIDILEEACEEEVGVVLWSCDSHVIICSFHILSSPLSFLSLFLSL